MAKKRVLEEGNRARSFLARGLENNLGFNFFILKCIADRSGNRNGSREEEEEEEEEEDKEDDEEDEDEKKKKRKRFIRLERTIIHRAALCTYFIGLILNDCR